MVAISSSLFGEPVQAAAAELESLGLVVAEVRVCSGSVREGEVRQILTGDGTVLDDKGGLTGAADEVPVGTVLQVKVGTGDACG